MIHFAAPLVIATLLLTGCADATSSPPATTDPTSTPSPTPAATPGETQEPTDEPRPTPTPTPEPTPEPVSEARFDSLEHDEVLIVVTDNLVVRSEPEVSDDSEIHDVVLEPGDMVWYRDGPRTGSGFEWIQGEVLDPTQPDGRLTGWVATGDNDSDELWLAVPRAEGDGWRLLGTGRDGRDYSVGVAMTQAEYEAEWAEAGATDAPPAVDFETELVVRFTHAVSSTCPDMDFHGIGIDADNRVVYSAGSGPIVPEGATGCTTDALPYAFIVAFEREIIPSGEVDVRLERGFVACADCGRDDEQVTIELP